LSSVLFKSLGMTGTESAPESQGPLSGAALLVMPIRDSLSFQTKATNGESALVAMGDLQTIKVLRGGSQFP
jgi:hypothetical protein